MALLLFGVDLVERRDELRFVRDSIRDLRTFSLDPVEYEFTLAAQLLDANLRLAAFTIVPVNVAAANKFRLILRPDQRAVNLRQRFSDWFIVGAFIKCFRGQFPAK